MITPDMISEKDIEIAALQLYGFPNQRMIAIEEMSELTKELSKSFRGVTNLRQIAEEIADVEIMLNQLKLHFTIEQEVNNWKRYKLQRLYQRIKEDRT